jgi:biotin carboxyl carrier protein
MSLHFQINEEHDVALTSELLKNFDIQALGNGRFHILKNNQSFHVELIDSDFANQRLTLLVNGNSYQIKIADEYDTLIKKLGLSAGTGQKVKEVKAPMPGLVLEVMVSAGQAVQKGDALLILEAMKMENIIKALSEGVVKRIQVEKGQTVEKGAILIEME